MIKLEFSIETVEQLHYERRYHTHPRVRQRMAVVYLKALDYPHQEIGRIVGKGRVDLPAVGGQLFICPNQWPQLDAFDQLPDQQEQQNISPKMTVFHTSSLAKLG